MECFNFQYAVKFVCGKVYQPPDRPVVDQPVARGEYFTAINIHNPTDGDVSFQYKIAVAKRRVGTKPSDFFDLRLRSDEALEIDCPDIMEHLPPPPPDEPPVRVEFVKGFVVIESDVELDVVAVYTAASWEGEVVSMHLERVAPRRPIRLPHHRPLPDQS
jgi:hypothetical protein